MTQMESVFWQLRSKLLPCLDVITLARLECTCRSLRDLVQSSPLNLYIQCPSVVCCPSEHCPKSFEGMQAWVQRHVHAVESAVIEVEDWIAACHLGSTLRHAQNLTYMAIMSSGDASWCIPQLAAGDYMCPPPPIKTLHLQRGLGDPYFLHTFGDTLKVLNIVLSSELQANRLFTIHLPCLEHLEIHGSPATAALTVAPPGGPLSTFGPPSSLLLVNLRPVNHVLKYCRHIHTFEAVHCQIDPEDSGICGAVITETLGLWSCNNTADLKSVKRVVQALDVSSVKNIYIR